MVMLNHENTATPIRPINPRPEKGNFRIHPDWLDEHKELTQGFKNFYSQVQRLISRNKQGYVSILAKDLAKQINVHPNTLTTYNYKAARLGLMIVLKTGRENTYILLYHPWMKITEDQAKQQATLLSPKMCEQIKENLDPDYVNLCKKSAQTNENKETSSSPETLKESFLNSKEGHTSQPSTINNVGNSTGNCVKSDIVKTNDLSVPVSNDTLKNTSDNSISPTPSVKLDSDLMSGSSEQTEDSAKKGPNYGVENLVRPTQNKGKFDYQVYLDFAKYEIKHGKKIISDRGLANYLLRTGEQDKQVTKFVEGMKEKSIGGNLGPHPHKVDSARVEKSSPSPAAPAANPKENVGEQIWNSYSLQEKKQIIENKQKELLENLPWVYAQMAKETFDRHTEALIKGEIAEGGYRANMAGFY